MKTISKLKGRDRNGKSQIQDKTDDRVNYLKSIQGQHVTVQEILC